MSLKFRLCPGWFRVLLQNGNMLYEYMILKLIILNKMWLSALSVEAKDMRSSMGDSKVDVIVPRALGERLIHMN